MSELPPWMQQLRAGQAIVADLRSRGLALRLEDGQPRVGPRELVDDDIRELLVTHREAVLVALRWERPT